MCWNAEVSLNTFLFSGFILCLIIYNNAYTQYKIPELNNVWMYIFLGSIMLIQLIEFFIWRNLKTSYNKVFSILAVLLLLFQPIASMMLISDIKIRNTIIAIYTVLAAPYSIYKFSTENVHSVVSDGHLQWKFFNIHIVFWLFFFLFGFVYEKYWVLIGLAVFLLLIVYYNHVKHNTAGSMWCWAVNSIMIYYAFYLLFYLPFKEKNANVLIC